MLPVTLALFALAAPPAAFTPPTATARGVTFDPLWSHADGLAESKRTGQPLVLWSHNSYPVAYAGVVSAVAAKGDRFPPPGRVVVGRWCRATNGEYGLWQCGVFDGGDEAGIRAAAFPPVAVAPAVVFEQPPTACPNGRCPYAR